MSKNEKLKHWHNALEELRKTSPHVRGMDREFLYSAGMTIQELINKHEPEIEKPITYER